MDITQWYANNFESRLRGRFITSQPIIPILEGYKSVYEISVVGQSEKNIDIPLIKIGNGKKKVLAWSQMHGNETTTTKAIFDLLRFLAQREHFQGEIEKFLTSHSLYILPMLNPDGALLYTRQNANGIDLNRDAQKLSQKESICLRKVFDAIRPELCLNLHDQRSIYGLTNGLPATVSFLSPAADDARTLTESRKIAMHQIVKMEQYLQQHLPGQIGRYDDRYNQNCVGDTFQTLGVPTILFEAGHFGLDYNREKTRELIFYAFISLFDLHNSVKENIEFGSYFNIPENLQNYNDIIIRDVRISSVQKSVSIALQYEEVLTDTTIKLEPVVAAIGDLQFTYGHREINASGAEILTYPQENLTIGSKLLRIVDKNDNSVVYFQSLNSLIP